MPQRTKNLSYEELSLWEEELTLREEEVKRKECLPAICNCSDPIPIIPDEMAEDLTITQKTLIENSAVNEFILKEIYVPLLEEARNDIREYRLLPPEDRKDTQIIRPSKFGVRTILEITDSIIKLLDKRDNYVTLLPDMNKEATIQSRIQEKAQEIQEGKIVSFHRNALPDTVYKSAGNRPGGQQVQVLEQMKQMEEINKNQNLGQMLF
ncbi:MAG TPA: hypothetical protein PKJ95_01635 [Atribacterota bacterium]|nr:hypothetical protein [Atribacterota bacterium]